MFNFAEEILFRQDSESYITKYANLNNEKSTNYLTVRILIQHNQVPYIGFMDEFTKAQEIYFDINKCISMELKKTPKNCCTNTLTQLWIQN